MGKYVNDVPNLGELFAEANDDVEWYDPNGHGYTIVTLTANTVTSDFYKVSTILETAYTEQKVASFSVKRDGDAMGTLETV